MAKRIYVGNLPLSATEGQISDLFSEFGTVEWVQLVTATDTGRSRGSGFVAMSKGASDAIQQLDRQSMGSRKLRVRPALPLSRSRTARTPKRARRAEAARVAAALVPA